MNVLNLSTNDYANFAHDNANALRSVGIDCVDLKTKAHSFNYSSQSKPSPPIEIKKAIERADLIQIFHSDVYLLNLVKGSGKRIVVYHTGTNYRDNPERMNAEFNPFVEMSIIALPEFSGLGCKNEHYVVGAIDCDPKRKNCFIWNDENRITYAHFPSNPEVKGTKEIIQMMMNDKIKGSFKFNHSCEMVNFNKQLKRMNHCNVYIELFKPVLRGKTYGSFGITALEAAKLGKIVITQNLNKDVYFDSYGFCPFLLANTSEQFYDAVNALNSMSKDKIQALQQSTFEWVCENHSYQATGNKLKSILKL